MRKGLFASVAALATCAGTAIGQGPPSAPPAAQPGYPAWSGPGAPARIPPTAGDPNAFLGGPSPYPAAPGPNDIPPAPDLPLTGEVSGPNSQHPLNPAAEPRCGTYVGQIHKAAGGPDRWWFDISEEIWHAKPMPLHYPLITTGPAAGGGVLNTDGTTVLVGNEPIDYNDYISVLRVSGGLWDSCRVWGLEMSGFISEDKPENFFFATPIGVTNAALARPVINSLTNQQTSLLIASPGNFPGAADARFTIHMGGAELNGLRNLMYCDQIKLNFLTGIRYFDLTEQADISSTSALPNASDPPHPINSNIVDQFHTHNQFLGGQIGFESELRRGRYFVDCDVKLAAGYNHERTAINGFTTSDSAGNLLSANQGGLLALASNSFTNSRNPFAILPEGNIKVGYQWTQRISTYVGFDALFLSRVMRPADQMNPFVNPSLVPVSNQFGANFGTPMPLNPMGQTNFWTCGATLGLTIRY